jgi:hypothetical protein
MLKPTLNGEKKVQRKRCPTKSTQIPSDYMAESIATHQLYTTPSYPPASGKDPATRGGAVLESLVHSLDREGIARHTLCPINLRFKVSERLGETKRYRRSISASTFS